MTSPTFTEHEPARAPLAGAALIGCGVASVALLAAHPGGGSPVLADVLRLEAAQAVPDAIVHGGFVLVLAIELVGFAALSVRAGPWRTSVLAAMIFAIAGTGLLSSSMILDGLVLPGVAARFADALATQEPVRAVLVLIGTMIRVLMPMGLAFLGAAALAWGAALAPMRGRAKVGGVIGAACGALIIIATGMSLQALGTLSLMFAVLGSAAWAITAGALLASWRTSPLSSISTKG